MPNARFCMECGLPFALQCPGCETEISATQKFCAECGTALTASSRPATTSEANAARKTVTALFADLGGSTGFAERNDAEIARTVLAQYHALLQSAVDAHGGTVAKFMGDGMMATFGIPDVAEDDALRAVECGRTLQLRFAEFATTIERDRGETLALRIGINTGEVVIAVGDADLIGDTLNVAARLEKECRPGHVLVGADTWRLTRGELTYESLGEVTVAGRAQPVAIYELASERVANESAGPLFGRADELQRLVSAFDSARAENAARLVTVLGSPGVGKTRLAREICERAHHNGARIFTTRCDRAGEATFAPVAQLLRDAIGLRDGADAAEARTAIGETVPATDGDHARLVEALAALVGAAPAQSVEETFWAIRRFVELTAARHALVIVIDDIQWAEALLLDLIEHLAEWITGAAVLLVALARPELRELRPALAEPGRILTDVVVLHGLDASATESLAASLLGAERLPAGLLERLPASTEGNPLFVRELVRMLVDDQVIRRRDDGEWELTIDAEAIDVPPTIQSLLGTRIERLNVDERELLEFASVVGVEFSLGALRELAGTSVPAAKLLAIMRRKELVEPTGTYSGDEPIYRFHHVLIRDATYRRLLKTRRAELHERVARWSDRTMLDVLGEHEATTAFHYEQAVGYRAELGSVDADARELAARGAELLDVAAQRAITRDDLAAAGALVVRALTLGADADSSARARLLMTGCECLLASGNADNARPLVGELRSIAGADAGLAAWANCFAAQLVGLTDPDALLAADASVREAAETLTTFGDGPGQAKAHQVRAGLLARLGRIGDAEAELDLALAAARAVDDRRRVTAVLGAAPDAALFGPSPVARAGGRCLDVVRLLRITSASPSVEAASTRAQAVLEALRGRFDVARRMLASARATLEDLGMRHGLAQTEMFAGMVEMIADDPRAAIAPLRAAFSGMGALGVGADAGSAAALLARALLADGQVDEADEFATASERLAGQNLKTAIGWRVARAEVLAARGAIAAAVAIAEEAVAVAARTDLMIDHADACAVLAAVRSRANDIDGARRARAEAHSIYERKGATTLAERFVTEAVDVGELSTLLVPPDASSASAARLDIPASWVLATWFELFNSGNFAEMRRIVEAGELVSDAFVRVDRRSTVAAPDADGSGVLDSLQALYELGLTEVLWQPIAIRGASLILYRQTFRSASGDELVLLNLTEVDTQNRAVFIANYDEAQLGEAVAELDERYIAGEGADHADALGRLNAHCAAIAGRSYDTITASIPPDFTVVDHRRVGWGTMDRDDYVSSHREYADIVQSFVIQRVDFAELSVIATVWNIGTDTTGGSFEWTFHFVGVRNDDGSPAGLEMFDGDDWAAATACFDALHTIGASVERTPRVGNAATTLSRRWLELSNAGRFDEARQLLRSDLVRVDHRAHLAYPPIYSADEYMAWHQGVYEQFDSVASDPIAVRGERLALNRTALEIEDGFATAFLMICELDDAGLCAALAIYDESQLADALRDLDERFIASPERPRVENECTAAIDRFFAFANARAWDEATGQLSPALVRTDRRRGVAIATTHGRDEYLAAFRAVFDVGFVSAEVRHLAVRGQRLGLHQSTFVAESSAKLVIISISEVDADGRVSYLSLYEPDDLADAYQAMEDRYCATAGDTDAYVIRRAGDFVRSLASLDGAATLALCHPDVQWTDHRLLGLGPIDLEELRGYLAARAEQIAQDRSYFRDLTVRGSTMLGRLWSEGIGLDGGAFLFEFLMVVRWSAGKLQVVDSYDLDEVVAAQARFEGLAERDDTGEGALHTLQLPTGNYLHAATTEEDFAREARFSTRVDNGATGMMARIPGLSRDGRFDLIADLVAQEYFRVDHRRGISAPTSHGPADFVAMLQATFDVGFDEILNTPLAVRGEWLALSRVEVRAPDGREIVFLQVHEWDASKLAYAAHYEEDDLAAAVAELDARYIAGKGAPANAAGRLDNAAVRFCRLIEPAFASRDWDAFEQLWAHDFSNDDRRNTVSSGLTAGRDNLMELTKSLADVGFTGVSTVPIAIRGEHLALARRHWHGVFDLEVLALMEVDVERGIAVAQVLFDPEDLAAAFNELDSRNLASEGTGPARTLGRPGDPDTAL